MLAVYLARTGWFLAGGPLVDPGTVGYLMPGKRSVHIVTAGDLRGAAASLAVRCGVIPDPDGIDPGPIP